MRELGQERSLRVLGRSGEGRSHIAHDPLAEGSNYGEESRMGMVRIRCPVSEKIALVTAGAIGGVPGSPTPPGASPLGTRTTSTSGISLMRSIGESAKLPWTTRPSRMLISP